MKQVRQSAISSVPKYDRYLRVDKRFITEGEQIEFNLYAAADKSDMSLFLQSETVVDGSAKVRLREIELLYISEAERQQFEDYVARHLRAIARNSAMPLDEKVTIIYEKASEALESMFHNPEALENVAKAQTIVGGVVDTILHDNATVASLMKITAHDYYTHTHSINVSFYALCLGDFLRMGEKDLEALGMAALLHDLGKSKVSETIINKNGRLSEAEFEIMKGHPAMGYEIACSLGISDNRILSGIRHHHEKLSGNGYPDRLGGERISHFARIIGVCDVFDALTTKRAYKDPMRSFDALLLMKNEMQGHLDMGVVDTFIKMLRE